MKKLISINDYFKDYPQDTPYLELKLSGKDGYQLKEFPEIESKKNLLNKVNKIDLSDNILTRINIKDLPSLKYLLIPRNLISEINLNLVNLIDMDLSHNMLSNIPNLINLPSLQVLNLTGNLINNVVIENLIPVKQTLKELYLNFNKINLDVQSFLSFIESLKTFKLESFSIEGNNFIEENKSLTKSYSLYIIASLKSLIFFNDEKIILNKENLNTKEISAQIVSLSKDELKSNNNIEIDLEKDKNKELSSPTKGNISIIKANLNSNTKRNSIISLNNQVDNNKINKNKRPDKFDIQDNEINIKKLCLIVENINSTGGNDQNLIFLLFEEMNKYILISKNNNIEDKLIVDDEKSLFSMLLMNIHYLMELNENIENALITYILEFCFIQEGIFSELSFNFIEAIVKASNKKTDMIIEVLEKVLIKSLNHNVFHFEVLENLMSFTQSTKIKVKSVYSSLINNVLQFFISFNYDFCFNNENKSFEDIKAKELGVCLDFLKDYLEIYSLYEIENNIPEEEKTNDDNNQKIQRNKSKFSNKNELIIEFSGELILSDSEDEENLDEMRKMFNLNQKSIRKDYASKVKFTKKYDFLDSYDNFLFRKYSSYILHLKNKYPNYYEENEKKNIKTKFQDNSFNDKATDNLFVNNNLHEDLANIDEPGDMMYNLSILSNNIIDIEFFEIKNKFILYQILFETIIFKLTPIFFKIDYFIKNKRKFLFVLNKSIDLIKYLSNSFDEFVQESKIDNKQKENLYLKVFERTSKDNSPPILTCVENYLRTFIFNYTIDYLFFDNFILNYVKIKDDRPSETENIEIKNIKKSISKIIELYGSLLKITGDLKLRIEISKDLSERILSILGLANNDCFILNGCCEYLFILLNDKRIIEEPILFQKIITKANELKVLFNYVDIKELKCKNLIERLYKYEKINLRINSLSIENIKNFDLTNTFISIIKLYKKIALLGNIGSNILDIARNINISFSKIGIYETFSELLKVKNDSLREEIVEFFYLQNHKNINYKILNQILIIISSYTSVTVGDIEIILSMIFFVFNRVALEIPNDRDIEKVLNEAGKLAINFIFENSNRNPLKRDEIIQKNQLNSVLILYLNSLGSRRDFIYGFGKEGLNIVKNILYNDYYFINENLYLPLEIERTPFGSHITYLYETTQGNNSLNPFTWIFVRVMIKMADLLCNIQDENYISNNLPSEKIYLFDNLFKEANKRINHKICNEKKNWLEFELDKQYSNLNTDNYNLIDEHISYITIFDGLLNFIFGKNHKTENKDINFEDELYLKVDKSLKNSHDYIKLISKLIGTIDDGEEINFSEYLLHDNHILINKFRNKSESIKDNIILYFFSSNKTYFQKINELNELNSYYTGDLLKFSKYGQANQKRIIEEENINNPYLRSILVSSFLRSIYSLLVSKSLEVKAKFIEVLQNEKFKYIILLSHSCFKYDNSILHKLIMVYNSIFNLENFKLINRSFQINKEILSEMDYSGNYNEFGIFISYCFVTNSLLIIINYYIEKYIKFNNSQYSIQRDIIVCYCNLIKCILFTKFKKINQNLILTILIDPLVNEDILLIIIRFINEQNKKNKTISDNILKINSMIFSFNTNINNGKELINIRNEVINHLIEYNFKIINHIDNIIASLNLISEANKKYKYMINKLIYSNLIKSEKKIDQFEKLFSKYSAEFLLNQSSNESQNLRIENNTNALISLKRDKNFVMKSKLTSNINNKNISKNNQSFISKSIDNQNMIVNSKNSLNINNNEKNGSKSSLLFNNSIPIINKENIKQNVGNELLSQKILYQEFRFNNYQIENIIHKNKNLQFNDCILFYKNINFVNLSDHIEINSICVLTTEELIVYKLDISDISHSILKSDKTLLRILSIKIDSIFICDYLTRILLKFNTEDLIESHGVSILFNSMRDLFNFIDILKQTKYINSNFISNISNNKMNLQHSSANLREIKMISFFKIIQKLETNNIYFSNKLKIKNQILQRKQLQEKEHVDDLVYLSEIESSFKEVDNFRSYIKESFPFKDSFFSHTIEKYNYSSINVFMVMIENKGMINIFSNKMLSYTEISLKSSNQEINSQIINKRRIIYLGEYYIYLFYENFSEMKSLPREEFIISNQTNNQQYADLMYSIDIKIRMDNIASFEYVFNNNMNNEYGIIFYYKEQSENDLSKVDIIKEKTNKTLSEIKIIFSNEFDFLIFKSKLDLITKSKNYEIRCLKEMIGN